MMNYKYFVISAIIFLLSQSVMYAQWSELDLPQSTITSIANCTYAMGNDCMIFAMDTSNIVYGFDQNSKLWKSHTAATNADWEYSSGGGKVCVVMNDSVAVAYSSILSDFCELELEGELLESETRLTCSDSSGIIITSERIYIYDALLNAWNSAEMTDLALISSIDCRINDDYLYIRIGLRDTTERIVAYSLVTGTLASTSDVRLYIIDLDHGFCFSPYENAQYAKGYSANTGSFEQIDVASDEEEFFDILPDITYSVSEHITCAFQKTTPVNAEGNATSTMYAFNTITGQFYSDVHTYRYNVTTFSPSVGGKFIAWAFHDLIPTSHEMIHLRIFRTSDNSFYWADYPDTVFTQTTASVTVGGKVLWLWDNVHLVAIDAHSGEAGMITFPDSGASRYVSALGDDWGTWGYKKSGTNILHVYYFSGHTDPLSHKEYDVDDDIYQKYLHNIHVITMTDADYGTKWAAYSPAHNVWYDFESTNVYGDFDYVPGDYVYVKYESKSRLELFDAIANQSKVYPLQSNFTGNNSDHLIFFNSENKYTGYSMITHLDNSYQVDKYYNAVKYDDISIIAPTGVLADLYPRIIYDGFRNNFAGLTVPDSVGTSMYNLSKGRFCFFLTTTAHIYAYNGDPGTMVGINEETAKMLPKEYMLSQNYPNPFNPSTTIQYALPHQCKVKIQIFNILGQVVAELVNEEQTAGDRSVIWNPNVASGVYFYRIEATSINDPANRFVDTKKMLMIK